MKKRQVLGSSEGQNHLEYNMIMFFNPSRTTLQHISIYTRCVYSIISITVAKNIDINTIFCEWVYLLYFQILFVLLFSFLLSCTIQIVNNRNNIWLNVFISSIEFCLHKVSTVRIFFGTTIELSYVFFPFLWKDCE